jgi:hypothetical protein
MYKEANYFQHFYNTRNDDKVLKIRVQYGNCWGYGLYFMLLETMAESANGSIDSSCIAELSLSYNISLRKLETFINFCLAIEIFYKDDTMKIRSKTMDSYKKFRMERRISGKKGAEKKWENEFSNIKKEKLDSLAIQETMPINNNKIKENIYINSTIPSVEEIKQYCQSRNNSIDAEQFFAFYESKGWKVGNQKMKNWKMAIITWEKRNTKQEIGLMKLS